MCNRPRLGINHQIDYHFFQSNLNRNAFLQNRTLNRNRYPVKKIAFHIWAQFLPFKKLRK
jgi:hypothetical protein